MRLAGHKRDADARGRYADAWLSKHAPPPNVRHDSMPEASQLVSVQATIAMEPLER